ncbi:ABC transporter permease [Microvirga sp. VF16]|nr:ABC transporter permease [Microvirga sp. VF16]
MLGASIRTALRSLRAHRLRSALTMLGIIIGVAAFVVMVAVGSGAREHVAAQIRSLGANLIGISPGSLTMRSVRLGRGASPRLNEDDARAIAAEVPNVVAVAPVLYSRAQLTSGASNWMAPIHGVTPDFLAVREWGVVEGREMTLDDNARSAMVVLLGATIREKLFGEADPVGTIVRLRGVPFTVIGVLDRKGQSVWGDDQDDVALVPLTTARHQLVGMNRASPRLVHGISVKYAEGGSAAEIMPAIGDLLRQRHRLPPGQDETFIIRNLAEVAGIEQTATRTLSGLLAAVAAVSLVVGGIGIMNIMLVSVTERTREIGLRLAVGAQDRDILAQFLIEAVTLAALGGLLGALVGIASSVAVAMTVGWSVLIDVSTLAVAIAFAGMVGVCFGFYPAWRAAHLDPIVALRSE